MEIRKDHEKFCFEDQKAKGATNDARNANLAATVHSPREEATVSISSGSTVEIFADATAANTKPAPATTSPPQRRSRSSPQPHPAHHSFPSITGLPIDQSATPEPARDPDFFARASPGVFVEHAHRLGITPCQPTSSGESRRVVGHREFSEDPPAAAEPAAPAAANPATPMAAPAVRPTADAASSTIVATPVISPPPPPPTMPQPPAPQAPEAPDIVRVAVAAEDDVLTDVPAEGDANTPSRPGIPIIPQAPPGQAAAEPEEEDGR